jgi:large subunit ribosomal protein L25
MSSGREMWYFEFLSCGIMESTELTIECKKRPEGCKPNALRRTGMLPANLYGHDKNESVSLVVETKAIERLMKKARLKKTEIEVNIPEMNWKGKGFVHEVQSHPAKGTLYHVSFYSPAKG